MLNAECRNHHIQYRYKKYLYENDIVQYDSGRLLMFSVNIQAADHNE